MSMTAFEFGVELVKQAAVPPQLRARFAQMARTMPANQYAQTRQLMLQRHQQQQAQAIANPRNPARPPVEPGAVRTPDQSRALDMQQAGGRYVFNRGNMGTALRQAMTPYLAGGTRSFKMRELPQHIQDMVRRTYKYQGQKTGGPRYEPNAPIPILRNPEVIPDTPKPAAPINRMTPPPAASRAPAPAEGPTMPPMLWNYGHFDAPGHVKNNAFMGGYGMAKAALMAPRAGGLSPRPRFNAPAGMQGVGATATPVNRIRKSLPNNRTTQHTDTHPAAKPATPAANVPPAEPGGGGDAGGSGGSDGPSWGLGHTALAAGLGAGLYGAASEWNRGTPIAGGLAHAMFAVPLALAGHAGTRYLGRQLVHSLST